MRIRVAISGAGLQAEEMSIVSKSTLGSGAVEGWKTEEGIERSRMSTFIEDSFIIANSRHLAPNKTDAELWDAQNTIRIREELGRRKLGQILSLMWPVIVGKNGSTSKA
jgi:hypothetical protein